MKITHYDANTAKLDDLILDWEDFTEEDAGEMRFGSDAGESGHVVLLQTVWPRS